MILNDKHPYLIAMLRAVQNGCEFPDYVSEKEYHRIRENKDENPALAGMVGFGCSFGGKWFAGYARDKRGTNYALAAKRSMQKIMGNLKTAEIICGDYRNVEIPPHSTIYADPPYNGTTGYGEPFDTDAFWEYMRKLSEDGHKVFVSEQNAPDDFDCIWQKEVIRSANNLPNAKKKVAIEKLFIYKKQ